MARKAAQQRREEAEALRRAVEHSRREWLGKRVQFRDLLDKKLKEGVFTEVDDEGHVTLSYQAFPWWPDEPLAELGTFVGHEQELLDASRREGHRGLATIGMACHERKGRCVYET